MFNNQKNPNLIMDPEHELPPGEISKFSPEQELPSGKSGATLEEAPHHKPRKVVKIIIILLLVGGVAAAGFWVYTLNYGPIEALQNIPFITKEDSIDKIDEDAMVMESDAGDVMEEGAMEEGEAMMEDDSSREENLIVGNYDQLVLTVEDIQSKFWFMVLDKEDSKEIQNFTELDLFNLGINAEGNYNFLGGYQNQFTVDADAVFDKIEKGDLEDESLSYLNSVFSKVVALSNVDEARDYLNKTRQALAEGLEELATEEDPVPENIITEFEVGEDGFKFSLLGHFVVFRVNNIVNAMFFLGQEEYISYENILALSKIQAAKYDNYKTPTGIAQNFSLDSDGDGLKDYLEGRYGTDINNPDSDGDSYLDGEEVINCYSPLGPEKIMNDTIINKLSNKDRLRGLGVYIPSPGENYLESLSIEEISNLEVVNPSDIMTGIYSKDGKRYFILGELDLNLVKSVSFNDQGELVAACNPYGYYQEGEPALCIEFGNANNFEFDCSVEFELQ